MLHIIDKFLLRFEEPIFDTNYIHCSEERFILILKEQSAAKIKESFAKPRADNAELIR